MVDIGGAARHLLPWLLAAAGGATLALALPGLYWTPLLMVFPGLLLESLGGVRRWRWVCLLGLWAGSVHWAVATHWVLPVMHDYGGLPLAVAGLCQVLMAIWLGLTWLPVAWVTWLGRPTLRIWLLPLAWSAMEAVRQLPPFIFPWNPTAAALSQHPLALQSLPVWGATGLTWAVTAAGAGLWGLCRGATRRAALLLLGTVAMLLTLASLLAPAPQPDDRPLVVAVLQPDTSLQETWDAVKAESAAARVWQLSREAGKQQPAPDLILWPESAVPYILERDPVFHRQLVALARELDAAIIINSIGSTPSGGYTNAAHLIRKDGTLAPRYDKVRLVPFGEYVPLIARFAFARSLVRQVASFSPGRSLQPLAGEVPIGLALCYEVVFPDLVAEEVRQGAQLLATISNDGWYGYSWAPEQHFAQAVLRAAETRRWLARAALTGISGIVAADGRVVARLGLGRSGLLTARARSCSGLTPRVRWGDWWGVLCGLGVAILVAARRRRSGIHAA